MQCIVPTCYNDDTSCISQGITFHMFPTDPLLCMQWLRALDKEEWKAQETSVICSNHFVKNDLYIDRNGQCKIRADAIPIVNLTWISSEHWTTPCDIKVCRVCFATGCNLYPMTASNKLGQAYVTLTGLPIEHDDTLPSYLCVECAQRLLNSIQFRTRSLRAHLVLLETIKKHDHLTLQSLSSTGGNLNLFRSNLNIKHNPIDDYDLKIEHMDSGDIEDSEANDIIDRISIEQHVKCRVKTEKDECNQNNSTVLINSDTVCSSLSIEVERIKTENEDGDQNSVNDDTTNEEMRHDDANEGKRYCLDDASHFEDEIQEYREKKFENLTNISEYSNPVKDDGSVENYSEENQIDKDKLLCESCPYQTHKELRLISHLKTHAKGTLLNCTTCNYKADSKRHLNAHMKMHSEGKRYSCDLCKKTFNTSGNLTRHSRIHSDEKPFSCDICGKAFKRRDHYKNHQNMHSDEKPFSCDTCNKGFTRQDHYKTHLELHSREKPYYSCEVCKTMFSRKSNLRNHMNLHSGEKPYSCDVCKKVFRRNNNLQKHYKLHRKKPYSCDLCGKCFIRKSELKIHIYLHSAVTPYTCKNKCKKVFVSKKNLRIHMKKYCAV